MKYFNEVNNFYMQSENAYKLLSVFIAEELIEKVMPYIDNYLKYCMKLFVNGDVELYWNEISLHKDINSRRVLYKQIFTEVSDEERKKRIKLYLDADVVLNEKVYDILSSEYI